MKFFTIYLCISIASVGYSQQLHLVTSAEEDRPVVTGDQVVASEIGILSFRAIFGEVIFNQFLDVTNEADWRIIYGPGVFDGPGRLVPTGAGDVLFAFELGDEMVEATVIDFGSVDVSSALLQATSDPRPRYPYRFYRHSEVRQIAISALQFVNTLGFPTAPYILQYNSNTVRNSYFRNLNDDFHVPASKLYGPITEVTAHFIGNSLPNQNGLYTSGLIFRRSVTLDDRFSMEFNVSVGDTITLHNDVIGRLDQPGGEVNINSTNKGVNIVIEEAIHAIVEDAGLQDNFSIFDPFHPEMPNGAEEYFARELSTVILRSIVAISGNVSDGVLSDNELFSSRQALGNLKQFFDLWRDRLGAHDFDDLMNELDLLDSDGDGIPDLIEDLLRDLNLPDTDGDGIPDILDDDMPGGDDGGPTDDGEPCPPSEESQQIVTDVVFLSDLQHDVAIEQMYLAAGEPTIPIELDLYRDPNAPASHLMLTVTPETTVNPVGNPGGGEAPTQPVEGDGGDGEGGGDSGDGEGPDPDAGDPTHGEGEDVSIPCGEVTAEPVGAFE